MSNDYLICDEGLKPIWKIDKNLFEKMVDTFGKLKQMGMLKAGSDKIIRNYVLQEEKEVTHEAKDNKN